MLSPDKFQFAERIVDLAGFRVSDSTIEPLPKYLNAVRDFPSTVSPTDIIKWFGLVTKVNNDAQLRDFMALFKLFLSPRCRFSWFPDLEKAFKSSKDAIVIFDMQKRTCLRPNWSRRGISSFPVQLYYTCYYILHFIVYIVHSPKLPKCALYTCTYNLYISIDR